MRVDPTDVQTHVLRSVNPVFAVYAFLKINDPARFRALLASLKSGLQVGGIDSLIYSEADRLRSERTQPTTDATAQLHTHVAFTLSGLQALGVDPHTLATFSEPFQEGMAARARILGDTGVAAPDRWDGYLGSSQVHGVLWCNFPRKAGAPPATLRDDFVTTINAAGAEVLHVETGEAHFRQYAGGETDRVEHFGFRDGISQPWIDFDLPAEIKLPAPVPGGGTPRQDDTWAPLAPGEFVLGYPDEDGFVQPWPRNKKLRLGGTYMVFRKLEQDVVGFRNFLRRAAGNGDSGRLAAQMIGRWPNGTPLVLSPDGPSEDAPRDPNRTINDFRYRDDPRGMRCPIGAHIRRVNPRDTNDRDEARRHRLLRRSISYGGPLLPEDSAGDGRKRGLLFVAFTARIDQQFEFVQSRWVNLGELVGQAGAGRDPLLSSHGGKVGDAFVSPSRPAPVTNLARFVTMRGGDYFFVPGLAALAGLAAGENFAPDEPLPKDAIGTLETPDPVASDELARLAMTELLPEGKPSFIIKAIADHPIAFVARHDHVTAIFKDATTYGVDPYADRIRRILGDRLLLISLPPGPLRTTRYQIMGEAFRMLLEHHHAPDAATLFAAFTRPIVDHVLKRVGPRGRLDLVGDIGRVVPIVLAERLIGIPGPGWVSPTAIASQFGRAEITMVPPSWLASLPAVAEDAKPVVSMQAWTRLAFLQVFVNVINAEELTELAAHATAELIRHIEQVIERAKSLPPSNATLLGCLAALANDPAKFGIDRPTFDEHMRLILAEMTVGGVETVNKALANVIDFALDRPAFLQALRTASSDSQVDALVREAMRFAPVSPILFRTVTQDTTLGGTPLAKGTVVCAIVQAAMFDPRVFVDPMKFDPTRDPAIYLHFGDAGPAPPAPHRCAGQNFAVAELRELVKEIVKLTRLRRAAGPAGKRQDLYHLPTSLVVRFDPVTQ